MTFTARITDVTPLLDQSTITNTDYGVVFAATEAMSNTPAYTDFGPAYTTTVNAPKWDITKSANTTVQPGERLTYTVVAQNIGHFATNGPYTITEVIPPQYITYVTSTPPATQAGNTLTWQFANSLAISESQVVTFVVQVNEPLTDGLALINADYTVTGGHVYTGAAGAPFVTTVSSTPNLTITKTAVPSPLVEAGAFLTYTLTITNQSPAQGPALNVLISDTIPANTVFRGASFVPPATGVFTETGSLLEWSLDDPLGLDEQAQVELLLQVQSPLPSGTLLINQHAVSASNATAWVEGQSVTSVVSSSAEIDGISKVVQPSSVLPGSVVTYTITITNSGNETASGVLVTDTLDANFPTSSYTFTNITIPGRDITGMAGFTTLVFTTTAPGITGIFSNTAITVTNGAEVATVGETAPLIVTAPVLSLTKIAASSAISVGESLAYTLIYTNSSPTAGTDTFITDTLPAGVIFVGSTPPTTTQVGNEVGWSLGTLGGNTSGTIVLTITIPIGFSDNTVITNSAIITTAEGFGAATGPVTVTVRAPVLHLAKASVPDPVEAGSLLNYTLTYSNSGGAATSARITDTFDSNTTFISATPPPDGGAGQIWFWDIPNLLPNGVDNTIIITVSVTSPLTNNTTLTNTASIGTPGYSDQDTETTTVSSSEILNIVKVGSNGTSIVSPGDLITYTISYSNSGNAIAQGVRITDTIDANTTFQRATSGYVANDPDYVWTINDLAPSNTFQITLTVRITNALVDGTVLTNAVIIRSNNGVTATAQATATVQSFPELHLVKRAVPNTIEAGESLTYTITYSNTGDAPATGVVLTDTLPPELHLQNANPAPDSGSDPTYRWDIGVVPVGGPFSITLVVTSDNVIADLAQLTNVVTMTNIETGPLTATEVITVNAVDLDLNKIVTPGTVKANEFVTYTITVQNLGHAVADNVIIADTLPISIVQNSVVSSTSPGVTFDSFTPPNLYVWTTSMLAGQASLTITISGQLITDPWPASGLVFTNTAVAGSDDGEADFSNNSGAPGALGRPGDPFNLVLTAVPDTVVIGNSIPVTATVTDQWGNPAFNGELVNFQTTFGTLLPTSDTTQNGEAITSISSNTPGVADITATTATAGITGTTTVTFTAGPPDHFIIAAIADQVAGVPFSITITVVDALNNPVTTYNNSATLADATGTLNPTATGASWVNGVWSGTVVITRAWIGDIITATEGVISDTSNLFDVLPGPPALATLNATTPVPVCGTSSISATVTDAFGNLALDNQSVTFQVAPLGPTFSTNPVNTSGGVAQTTLSSTTNGAFTVGVDVDGDLTPEDTTGVTFTNPPTPTGLTLSVAPNPLYTGGNTAIITATVTDCTGSPAGHDVVITISDPALASLATNPITITTNASGIATTTLTSNSTPVTGLLTITGTTGSLIQNTTLDIQLPPTPVLTIAKFASPSGSNVRPGQTINYTIRVTNTGTGPASNIIITDTLPTSVGYVSGGSSGGVFAYDTGTRNFTATIPTLGINTTLVATIQVTVTAAISGTPVNNSAVAASTETGLITSNIINQQVFTGTTMVYAPIILKGGSSICADLEITEFTILPGNVVRVVVTNAGTCVTDSNFWVDLYANPVTLPGDLVGVTADRAWNSPAVNATHGMAWEAPVLAAGASVIFTSDGSVGTAPQDILWPPPAGATLYAYADSFDNNDANNATVVEIPETDETDNQAGPLIFPAAVGSGSTETVEPPPAQPRRDLH
jgi:uncharacterized repeat protein (TIGR01451 family)